MTKDKWESVFIIAFILAVLIGVVYMFIYTDKVYDRMAKRSIEVSKIINQSYPAVPVFKNSPDTAIGQQVWYYKGQYVLQTWLNTNKYQFHYSIHTEGLLNLPDRTGIAPYNVDIIGSFDYIKSNKANEYMKAVNVLDSLRLKGNAIQIHESVEQLKVKAIDDSIELIKKVPLGMLPTWLDSLK